MSFTVTKKAPELVAPAEPTPTGPLPLSPIDNSLFLRFFQQLLHVYKHGGEQPVKVIREAISKALVHYYPVAGRLRATGRHQRFEINSVGIDLELREVDCTGDGIFFVEAAADCELADVGYMDRPPFVIPVEQLFPSPPPDVELHDLAFLMQVYKLFFRPFNTLENNFILILEVTLLAYPTLK